DGDQGIDGGPGGVRCIFRHGGGGLEGGAAHRDRAVGGGCQEDISCVLHPCGRGCWRKEAQGKGRAWAGSGAGAGRGGPRAARAHFIRRNVFSRPGTTAPPPGPLPPDRPLGPLPAGPHPLYRAFSNFTRMRKLFYLISIVLLLLIAAWGILDQRALWAYVVVLPLFSVGIYNMMRPRHTILRNFPVLGYARYAFEFIAPEIQQYFIERHTDGRPFSRQQRSLAYQRAKNIGDSTPFGTQQDINAANYEGLRHSIYPKEVPADPPRVRIGGAYCKKPYMSSLLNVSAMSFGSLSDRAVLALNTGARKGGFYHNTGEGGLSPHHLKPGGDLVWQIGTAYFGCRDAEGNFDPVLFRSKVAEHHQVRMIELKLSQGAKPGHGGRLPAV